MKHKNQPVPSVNFHLWEPCNFRCKFCFATFQDVKKSILPKGHLAREDALKVVQLLAESGFEKITFAGGEPTLCPWLDELIATAGKLGMTTNLVTNGWVLLKSSEIFKRLSGSLRWLTLSIDSLDPQTNASTGRAFGGKQAITRSEYLQIVRYARELGLRIKINTVVHQANRRELLRDFLEELKPDRWKIFQVLSVVDQNFRYFEEYSISKEQFNMFLRLNSQTESQLTVIPETNQQMRASYVMIDPAGRFFDNATGKHTYSNRILKVGIANALKEVNISPEAFFDRNGLYDWK